MDMTPLYKTDVERGTHPAMIPLRLATNRLLGGEKLA